MNWQSNLIVYGSLVLIIALTSGGYFLLPSMWGVGIIAFAVLSVIVWLFAVFDLAMAMGED